MDDFDDTSVVNLSFDIEYQVMKLTELNQRKLFASIRNSKSEIVGEREKRGGE